MGTGVEGGGDGEKDELEKVAQVDRMEKLGYHIKCCTLLLDVSRLSITEFFVLG